MTTRHHQIIITILTTESYNYLLKMTWRELSVMLNNIAEDLTLFKGPKGNKSVLAVLTSVRCLRNEGIFFIIWAKLLTVIWGKCMKNYTALYVNKQKNKKRKM